MLRLRRWLPVAGLVAVTGCSGLSNHSLFSGANNGCGGGHSLLGKLCGGRRAQASPCDPCANPCVNPCGDVVGYGMVVEGGIAGGPVAGEGMPPGPIMAAPPGPGAPTQSLSPPGVPELAPPPKVVPNQPMAKPSPYTPDGK